MKGDFTRDTFDPNNHFSRVLMQQGRVQLDADWNEQTSILLHYLRTLAADLIGPYGGPAPQKDNPGGFNIELSGEKVLTIGKGRYYVSGTLCENDQDIAYTAQPGYPFPGSMKLEEILDTKSPPVLVYLDVWERHLTYLEVEDADGSVISIREAALRGPDTATRSQVVWQVKAINKLPDEKKPIPKKDEVHKNWPDLVLQLQPTNRGLLKARAIEPESSDLGDPCTTSPESRYRGVENQLYRVEIHQGGVAWDGLVKDGKPEGNIGEAATFKWSRENGSVIFPVREIADKIVTLENLGRDRERLGLRVNDWVEIVDDDCALQNRPGPLLQVDAINPDANEITLKLPPEPTVGQDRKKHPILRRWDQRETDVRPAGGVPVTEKSDIDKSWIQLEDGVQIQFQPPPPNTASHQYGSGDYWLIPARTATGDVEQPGPPNKPEPLPPHGVRHYYAPLWLLTVDKKVVSAENDNDLRLTIKPD